MVAWIALAPVWAAAQERRELRLQAGETPVTVLADRIESLERERLLIAEGRVEIEQGDVRLQADRVEVNTETTETVALGRVVFFDGRDRLTGERLEYNFRNGTGIVYRAEAFAEPHFFFGGERMERFGDKAYRLFRGVFTTCEGETPAWSVRWGQATAYLDDYMWGTNASFWVWKIPLVPFIPIFAANLRKDRHTGFLTPDFGSSSKKGFTVRLPFFWAISDSQDLTLVPTYFEKRGFQLGAAYRYIRTETSRGEIEGSFLRDTQVHQDRWVVGLRHEETIRPRLTLKADLAQVSDDNYFKDYGNALDERTRQRLESNLSVTQRWDKWNLVGRLFAYEDLTTAVSVELQRLPEITLNAFQQPVPGIKDLLFQLDSSYVNFVRDVGANGQRLDLHPRLSYPFSPGGYLTITPRVGGRETLYDTRVTGVRTDRGFLVEDTEKEAVSRSLFEASLDVEARAYRVFDLGGALGIQRLQHVIEPRVSYNYISDADDTKIPQYDGIDAIRSTNGVTYSLTNRLKARAVPSGDAPGRVWELLRLTLSQTYDLESPPRTLPATLLNTPVSTIPTTVTSTPGQFERNRLSDLTADLILEPLFGIKARASAALDPYRQGRITTATTDLAYEAKAWRASVGTRHGDGGRLQFVQGTAQARLGSRWAARFSTNYDTETSTVVENRFEVDFREQCWSVTVAYVNRTTEDEFHISINLLELGQYGFGRGFTSQ